MSDTKPIYRLEEQVGFLLRKVTQRHLALFSTHIPDLTPTQFAALAKLCELGDLPQNELGRHTAMDAATIKGVVDRLRVQELVATQGDREDLRRVVVKPTAKGIALFQGRVDAALATSAETLSPLSQNERSDLIRLLIKLA